MVGEPGRTRVLNEKEQEKINEWLSSKGVSRLCESCGKDAWVPGPVVRAIGIDTSVGEADWDNASIPMVQVLCENCGYIRHYSAGLIGLL